jgi:serine protease Do
MKKFAKIILTAMCAMGLVLSGGYVGARVALHTQSEQSNIMPASAVDDNALFATLMSRPFENAFENTAASNSLSMPELFTMANPAVVAISTETTGRNIFGRVVTLPAAGSGFIVSSDGYVVTNDHVIGNANRVSVLLYDGTTHEARVIGRDPNGDLAVLKIDAANLSFLTFGDSENLLVGEQVAAIGNPLGEFANSMTVGVISALDREINIDGTPQNMLQTDTAVNRGNSGGPLLNAQGQVIGVVTAKSGGTNVEGLGFAIPSNIAEKTVTRLINNPIPVRPVMGVTVSTVINTAGQTMVRVEYVVSGSAAQTAGVRIGDLVLSANGTRISVGDELINLIAAMNSGDEMKIVILRGGEEITLSVVLGESRAL